MHARELVELSAFVASHGPLVVDSVLPLSATHLQQYWTGSRCRLNRWSRFLRQTHLPTLQVGDSSGQSRVASPVAAHAVIEEIFTSEMLTRVWAAVLFHADRQRGVPDAEPVGRSVLTGHLEARRRALRLIVDSESIPAEDAVQLNRLRRRTERWTDLLLGHLQPRYDVRDYAFEPERVLDFAAGFARPLSARAASAGWTLTLFSLRNAFASATVGVTGNADMNAHLAGGILGCLGAEPFSMTGAPRSLWWSRLASVTGDLEGQLADLIDVKPRQSIGREIRFRGPHMPFPTAGSSISGDADRDWGDHPASAVGDPADNQSDDNFADDNFAEGGTHDLPDDVLGDDYDYDDYDD